MSQARSEAKPTAEEIRLEEDRLGHLPWRRWGPYLSERSWGTVREDYSPDGSAWTYLTHDQARSKAYRWGEDGLAGLSDRYQLLAAGRILREQRLQKLEDVIRRCRNAAR